MGKQLVVLVLALPFMFMPLPNANATTTWTKIYETTTSSRNNNSATSEMTYTAGFGKTGGAASSFIAAGTSWDLVKIRMEMNRIADNQTYFAEVTFDKWVGATIDGLQFPDHANALVNQRNISNLVVASNFSGVKTGSYALGRLEIWPYNYSQARSNLSPPGNAGTFDWDDTYIVGSDGHGSFQIHNLTDTQTIMAWNMHRPGTQEMGFGSRSTGEPDWTFAANAEWNTTNFKVQVFVASAVSASTVNAPVVSGARLKSSITILTATASTAGKITFYGGTRKIPGCSSRPTSNIAGVQTATCNFKPNTSGYATYSARFVPTSSSFTNSQSTSTVVQIGRRSGVR
ncbi:MAG: hypothetical protein F2565_00580 [Actinobacteria bacterium]|nr:hypothetical protein [Actinomycetota bacterium]